jgi:chemotaxis protein CheX
MSETYALPPKLDLPAAAPLAQELSTRLGADLTLDASGVAQIGSLCTQVIVSAGISLRAGGHQLKIINMTDKALEQLGYLGFTPESIVEAEA